MANVDEEFQKLRADMDQIRSDLAALTTALQEAGVAKGRETLDRAKRSTASLKEEAEALRARADREIEERPLTSVLTSFGIGFLVGLLMERRR